MAAWWAVMYCVNHWTWNTFLLSTTVKRVKCAIYCIFLSIHLTLCCCLFNDFMVWCTTRFIGYTASTAISIESKLRRCVRAPKNTSHTSRTHTFKLFLAVEWARHGMWSNRLSWNGHWPSATSDTLLLIAFSCVHVIYDFDFENAFLRFAIFYTEFAVHK